MNIELTSAQLRKVKALLSRIQSVSKGDVKIYNLARLIVVELLKSERRAKRSANAKAKMKVQSTKIVEQ